MSGGKINMEQKPFYLSKTLWLQVIGVIMIIVPTTRALLQEYFAEAGMGWAMINIILRLISKDKLSIS